MSSLWNELSKDIFDILIKYLSFEDFVSCSRVNKSWRRIITLTNIRLFVCDKTKIGFRRGIPNHRRSKDIYMSYGLKHACDRVYVYHNGRDKRKQLLSGKIKLTDESIILTPWTSTKYIKPINNLETQKVREMIIEGNPRLTQSITRYDVKYYEAVTNKAVKGTFKVDISSDEKNNIDYIRFVKLISFIQKLKGKEETIYLFLNIPKIDWKPRTKVYYKNEDDKNKNKYIDEKIVNVSNYKKFRIAIKYGNMTGIQIELSN